MKRVLEIKEEELRNYIQSFEFKRIIKIDY